MTVATDVGTWGDPPPPGELGKLALWEAGRRKLGYGDWTPEHPDPYQKWSGLESHKLYLVMRKRHITADEFMLCVDYCHRHHKRIENAVWVFRFIPEAKVEQRELEAQLQMTDLGQMVEAAMSHERALAATDSNEWIGKLTRARGPYRQEVLAQWRAARQQ